MYIWKIYYRTYLNLSIFLNQVDVNSADNYSFTNLTSQAALNFLWFSFTGLRVFLYPNRFITFVEHSILERKKFHGISYYIWCAFYKCRLSFLRQHKRNHLFHPYNVRYIRYQISCLLFVYPFSASNIEKTITVFLYIACYKVI